MNFKLNCGEEFEDFIVYIDNRYDDEVRYRFRFDNKYGASVIKTYGSYGYSDDLWELAVIYYTHDNLDDFYQLDYDTPITDDVIGRLDDEEVVEILREIKNL